MEIGDSCYLRGEFSPPQSYERLMDRLTPRMRCAKNGWLNHGWLRTSDLRPPLCWTFWAQCLSLVLFRIVFFVLAPQINRRGSVILGWHDHNWPSLCIHFWALHQSMRSLACAGPSCFPLDQTWSTVLFLNRCFLKWEYPQIIHFNGIFQFLHYKPTIFG